MISVALATYNGEKYIIKQLESIKNQSVKPDEVIICDDLSKDSTAKLINEYIEKNELKKTWKLVINERNLGYIKNFIKAITLTHGDYIFLSDQDDIFYKNKFEEMLKILRNKEDCVLLNANYEIIDENDKPSKSLRIKAREKRKNSIQKINFKRWLYESSFPGFSMGFKSCIREKLLVANIDNCYGHDQMIGLFGISLDGNYEINKVLSGYRIHAENITGGTKITNNYSITSRIKQKEKEKAEYELLNKMISDNKIKNVDKDFLFLRQRELEKRLLYLKNRNIFKAMLLILTSKAYPKSTILGDCVYILKGK